MTIPITITRANTAPNLPINASAPIIIDIAHDLELSNGKALQPEQDGRPEIEYRMRPPVVREPGGSAHLADDARVATTTNRLER